MHLTLNQKKIAAWLGVVATALSILVALQNLHCNSNTILQPSLKSKVTREVRTASVRSRPDTVWIHDTVEVAVFLRAKANKFPTDSSNMPTPSSGSDSLSSQVVCLDSLLASGDTTAGGPDTISVCLDKSSDIFSIALGLAPRERTIAAPFIHSDSIIVLKDSMTIEKKIGQSFWDILEKDLEIVGSFVFGVLLGRIL